MIRIPRDSLQQQPRNEGCLDPAVDYAVDGHHWREVCERFLNALDPELREAVQNHLNLPSHSTGPGLRMWLKSILCGSSVLPEKIPSKIVEVYLHYSEAVPLYDCETCGLAVPIIPNRIYGFDDEPEKVFFPTCPICGGRTGLYSYWSMHGSSKPKPR